MAQRTTVAQLSQHIDAEIARIETILQGIQPTSTDQKLVEKINELCDVVAAQGKTILAIREYLIKRDPALSAKSQAANQPAPKPAAAKTNGSPKPAARSNSNGSAKPAATPAASTNGKVVTSLEQYGEYRKRVLQRVQELNRSLPVKTYLQAKFIAFNELMASIP